MKYESFTISVLLIKICWYFFIRAVYFNVPPRAGTHLNVALPIASNIENLTRYSCTCYYTDSGREWLYKNWKLCVPLDDDDDVRVLKSWASEVYVALSMVNYPYKADFLAPLPANPVKVIRLSIKKPPPILIIIITYRLADYVCMIRLQELCKSMTNHSEDAETLLKSVFAGLSVYFNYTGTAECLDISSVYPVGMNGWDYQVGKQREIPCRRYACIQPPRLQYIWQLLRSYKYSYLSNRKRKTSSLPWTSKNNIYRIFDSTAKNTSRYRFTLIQWQVFQIKGIPE